jgi:hypothetical protein
MRVLSSQGVLTGMEALRDIVPLDVARLETLLTKLENLHVVWRCETTWA